MQAYSIGQTGVRFDKIHIISVLAYAMICALGSLCPPIGVAFIALFALVGSFIAIIRNIPILMLVLLIGGLSVAIPPIGIVAFLIMVYLFIRRVGFLIHHWKLILLGIFAYSSAIGLVFLGSLFNGNVLGICAMGVIGGLIFHAVLNWANSNGYATEKAIEIMSIIPLLLISFILPFLKLHFGADHLNPDMNVAHGVDTAPVTPAVVDAAAMNTALIHPHGLNPNPTIGGNVINGVHYTPVPATDMAPSVMTGTMQSHHLGVVDALGSTSSPIHPVFDQFLGRTEVIDNHLGQLTARVVHHGNTDILQNSMGREIGRFVHQENTTIVQDSTGQMVGRIIHDGNVDTIHDANDLLIGRITHSGNSDALHSPLGLQTGRVIHTGNHDVVQNMNGQTIYMIQHQSN